MKKNLLAMLLLATLVFTACDYGTSDVEDLDDASGTDAGTEVGLVIEDGAESTTDDGTAVEATVIIDDAAVVEVTE